MGNRPHPIGPTRRAGPLLRRGCGGLFVRTTGSDRRLKFAARLFVPQAQNSKFAAVPPKRGWLAALDLCAGTGFRRHLAMRLPTNERQLLRGPPDASTPWLWVTGLAIVWPMSLFLDAYQGRLLRHVKIRMVELYTAPVPHLTSFPDPNRNILGQTADIVIARCRQHQGLRR